MEYSFLDLMLNIGFPNGAKTAISVLVAGGRARVGVAASVADWPKRIRDLQFLDHEGYAATT